MSYLIIIFLVLLSGLFSGMTLGFFSLRVDSLKRKAELGDKRAIKVYPIRKKGNLLLCTLLIGNVLVNSVLSIFLGSLLSGVLAVFLATGLIVIFGEILPQASFSRYALTVGAKFSWLVRIFIFLFYPLCAPIAWLLDKMLGDEMPTMYSKKELIMLVEDHEDSSRSDIDADEERIIKGALSYSNKTVKDIMTKKENIFSVEGDLEVTEELIHEIQNVGHSRIPVRMKGRFQIIGILYVKDIVHKKLGRQKIKDLMRKDVYYAKDTEKLDNLLNAFKSTRNHLFIVRDKTRKLVGIVTIEDVIEEIIGSEIIDEFDNKRNLHKYAKK
ncbi:MAG: hypothetical protein COU27_02915 [Candidatus Levybacteria bacterium CG10_big_fil_rev_8_21_14_0_10_36_7]|nr:MAG: hypothetical protein COU27_02915 [Candidatus Levybacteria bacterium CG10_big_fil_rev_8_21_14_0_10_36_7]